MPMAAIPSIVNGNRYPTPNPKQIISAVPPSTKPISPEKAEELEQEQESQLKQAREEIDKQVKDQTDEIQNSDLFVDLSGYIRTCWDAALDAKKDIQTTLYESSLQRQGRYTDDKLAEIATISSSTIFMNITNVKCRAAESWLRDIATSVNDKMWSIEPTVLPSLSPELSTSISQYIQKQMVLNPYLSTFESQKELYDYLRKEVGKIVDKGAHDVATRMETKIEDQLQEANWDNVLDQVRADIVTYKAGILKFPVTRKKRVMKWVQDKSKNGKWTPKQDFDVVLDCDRVSPFDLYPSPYSTTIDDGYLFEVHRLTRQDILDMIDIPGYDESSIRTVLNTYPNGYKISETQYTTSYKDDAENRDNLNSPKLSNAPIETLEFWGTVPGRLLLDWGMKSIDIPDPDMEYQANVWIVDKYIIKAVLNKNLDGKKPYFKTSFENINGSFWGKGIPEIIKDIQDVCNATARALINNLAIASGPQIIADISKLRMGTDIEDMYPFKIWHYDSDSSNWNSSAAAIDFFQPDSNSAELLHVYNDFSAKADDHTGIPPYVYGSTDVGGAGRTASGLSMLMTNAAKGIKYVVANIDRDIIAPAITVIYNFNMLYDPDDSIKGDLSVVAKGVLSLISKEQLQIRRMEFMNMVSNSPTYLSIVGKKGAAYLLRESAKTLDIDTSKIMPDEEELERMEEMEKEMAMQQQQMEQMGQPGQQPTQSRGTLPNVRRLDVAGAPVQGTDTATMMNRQGVNPG